MVVLMLFLWLAAIVQIAIAAANLFLLRKLKYKENLERVAPIIRQVFVVHSVYDASLREPIARATWRS